MFVICIFVQFSEIATEDKLEYNFFPVSAGSLQFRVKASNDAHVALTSGPAESDPMYEVIKINY